MPASMLARIDKISETAGDFPEGLLVLESFSEKAPAICFPDGRGYRGEFPTLSSEFDNQFLANISSLEIPARARERFSRPESGPKWLSVGPKGEVFDGLLESDDLRGAWLALNSHGWTFEEIRCALPRLVAKARDDAFAELADCWLSVAHGEDGGSGY